MAIKNPTLATLAALALGVAAATSPALSAGGRLITAKLSASPSSVTAGTVSTLVFKYQAALAFANSDITLVVPAGWTPPVSSPPTADGFVSTQAGSCTVPNPLTVSGTGPWTVRTHGVACGVSKTFTLTFARTTYGVPGTASAFAASAAGVAVDPVVLRVSTGPASRLAFTQVPDAALGGTAFTTQPRVAVTDLAGNLIGNSRAPVALGLLGGASGAALTCAANPRTATSGVASFAGCAVDLAGAGYQLRATSGTLAPAVSTAFAVTPGPATRLGFTRQPGPGDGGQELAVQPEVSLLDAGGNVATGAAPTVALTIAAGTGDAGAVLGCDLNPVAAAAGVASFSGCAIDRAASGYRLRAVSGVLAPVDSDPFAVAVGPSSGLSLVLSPTTVTAGDAGSTATVTVTDLGGNGVTGLDLVLSSLDGATISPETDNGDGTYTTTVAATSAGTDTISASVAPSGPVDSAPLTVLAGAPASVALLAGDDQTTVVGRTFDADLQVVVQDAFGNAVPAGTLVAFTCTSLTDACATFASPVGVVGTQGYATTTATANSSVGAYTITATAGTGSYAFTASNIAAAVGPAALVLQGADQSVQTGFTFPLDVVVQVIDEAGDPVQGVPLYFTSSGQTFLQNTEQTQGDGTVRTVVFAGSEIGTFAVDVHVCNAYGQCEVWTTFFMTNLSS